MPIKIRKTLLHEPITFDTIGNHWDQVPIYRPNGYPLYHYLQTEKGVGKIEIQGKSYLLNENGIKDIIEFKDSDLKNLLLKYFNIDIA